MRRFGTVIFDCDSTLSAIEGIEELASAQRAEVVALTESAMRGEVPLEEVYGRRLELVRPTRDAVRALGRRYVATLLPDAREVVAALRRESIEVRILSGGLRPAVEAAGAALGLGPGSIEAVDVRFDGAGRYAGFDTESPLARSGGKREIIEAWRTLLPIPFMLVGDGATDLEARPSVDLFVAFAGVVHRPEIAEGAHITVHSPSLAPVFALALGERPPADPAARPLYEKGLAELRAGVDADEPTD